MAIPEVSRVWLPHLDEVDLAAHADSGYGAFLGLGDRPALLVVDVVYAFTGRTPETAAADVERWPDSCGTRAWESIPRIARILEEFRARGLPVVHARVLPSDHEATAGLWRRDPGSTPALDPSDAALGAEFVDEVRPAPGELVVARHAPSAFFGSSLIASLTRLGVDSLVVCGTTTSGCVRATVVDAFSYNLPVVVPVEGVFDRLEASHAIALFDMDARYADVVTAQELIGLLPPA